MWNLAVPFLGDIPSVAPVADQDCIGQPLGDGSNVAPYPLQRFGGLYEEKGFYFAMKANSVEQ